MGKPGLFIIIFLRTMNKPANYLFGLISTLLVLGVSFEGYSQTVSNVKARSDPNNPNLVIISYDLRSTSANQSFNVELLSSADNFQKVLEKVSGDVGENQIPGNGKQVFWRAREELGLFSGNITFEIRSTVMFRPIRLTGPNASDSFEPGSSMPIRWEGGFKNATMQLELFRANILNRNIITTPNTKEYNWIVPADLERGSNYKVKLYDLSDPSTSVMSPNFTINAAALKASKKGGGGKKWIFIGLGVAAVGVAAVLVLGGGDDPPGTDDPNDPTRDPLPVPPDTPDGGSMIRKIPALISFNLSR